MTDKFAKASKYAYGLVTAIDAEELAVRLAETVLEAERPPDTSPREALASMSNSHGQLWLRAAEVAMEYWHECIQNAQRPS